VLVVVVVVQEIHCPHLVLEDLVVEEMQEMLPQIMLDIKVQLILVVEVVVDLLVLRHLIQVVPVVPVSSLSHTLHHKTSKTLLKLSHTPPQGPTRHRILSR
jgi:hypothetical protein